MITHQQPTQNTIEPSGSMEGFNLREQILKYVSKWYLFLIGVLLFGILAFIYIRYTIPKYNVTATVLISQDDSMNESELAAFKDLGLLDNAENKVENEILIMKSRTLITNVVKKLGLHISYFAEGRILEAENYPKSIIEMNFLAVDSVLHDKSKNFNVKINSATSFSFVDKSGAVISDHSFGKTITTEISDAVITPVHHIEKHIGKTIKVKVRPVNFVAEAYRNKIKIFPAKSNSSIVKISLNDPVKEKAKDIINSLIEEYNISTVENKKLASAKTAEFINERLDLISGDLSEVDEEAAGYKSKFGLTNDVAAQTQRVADIDSRNLQEIAQLDTQLRLIESMQSFITSQEGKNDAIPANLGFDDPTVSNTVSQYNQLIFQKKRLLKSSSSQNPVVVNIEEQLQGLRQVLIGSLNSLKGSIDIKLNSLRTQDKYFSGKLYSAPIRQKDLRVIEREQTIKEQLYLYLLQKREEAEITSHITVSNSRVIDRASTIGLYPVSPNKKVIYLGAIFMGLLLPFCYIYLSDLLNVKVTSRKDLEKALSIPIIGSIPKAKKKNGLVISRTSRTGIAEAFRILRTNLNFLLAGKDKEKGNTIFVTSTISGEGKTLISTNLAKTLAISGKKVILVGTDFRDPKFHKYIDLPGGKETKGFTNYIMNTALTPDKVIMQQKEEDPIAVLSSGPIPPNPAELLMQDRVTEMFTHLKTVYDYIIVDTAPVSMVTDTLLIGNFADLSIYVVRENYSDRKVLKISEHIYQEKRLPNMAVLLNESGAQNGYAYGYGN